MKKFLGFPPCQTSEPYIFVSYCHKDQKTVASATSFLHDHGYRIWYDSGVDTGAEWRDEIARHIHDCHVFISFHSASSNDSDDCRAELDEALSSRKPIIPVYLDEVNLHPGDKMYLRKYQAEKLYEYESPVKFAEECLLSLPSLAACRESASTTESAPPPSAVGPISWVMNNFSTLTIEPVPAPEGEFKLLLSVRSRTETN